ncbi:MAG TPA: response regulator [Anaeromyxobacteraceae bacterium]|nr:response regulator [Anaeromyxobacteraceae bacterium]
MTSAVREPVSRHAPQARILVCDDAATVRAMMAMLLGRRHALALTSSAEEALERAPEFAPDLVITDLLLPGMSGQELIRRLRAIPAFEEVPMILLSAVRDTDARVDGLEAGADDYLVKPIRERELLARVASLLRLRRAMLTLSQRSRALEEANLALHATREQLARSERLAAIGSLAAGLAHDINNPLSLVTSAAAALLALLDRAAALREPVDPAQLAAGLEELRGIAEELTAGGRRLQALGRDLRLFGAGGRGLPTQVSATEAAQAAISFARDASPAPPDVALAEHASPVVDAPPHLVTFALLSILERAVLSAGRDGHVRVEVDEDAEGALVTITDDGPPIPVDLLPRVFEPFVRLHPAHEARGLGLAVAAGIVLGLGGHIDVDGQIERGARFRVRFPAAPRPDPAPQTNDAGEP